MNVLHSIPQLKLSLSQCVHVCPQRDVKYLCMCLYTCCTSAGLMVNSISKPFRGLNQAERNFAFIFPSLHTSFLSFSVSECHGQLLAGLQMQTAAQIVTVMGN